MTKEQLSNMLDDRFVVSDKVYRQPLSAFADTTPAPPFPNTLPMEGATWNAMISAIHHSSSASMPSVTCAAPPAQGYTVVDTPPPPPPAPTYDTGSSYSGDTSSSCPSPDPSY